MHRARLCCSGARYACLALAVLPIVSGLLGVGFGTRAAIGAEGETEPEPQLHSEAVSVNQSRSGLYARPQADRSPSGSGGDEPRPYGTLQSQTTHSWSGAVSEPVAACTVPLGPGHAGTLQLTLLTAPFREFRELCAALAPYLAVGAPPFDARTTARVERLLLAPGYFRSATCLPEAEGEQLSCALVPLEIVRDASTSGGLPFALLRQDLSRRLFLRPGVLLTSPEAMKAQQERRLEDYLVSEGYFGSQVQVVTRPAHGAEPNQGVDLDARLRTGGSVQLRDILVEGDEVLPEEEIRDIFVHPAFILFGQERFRPTRFDDDLQELTRRLQSHGWPEARVRGEFTLAPEGDTADVTLFVHVGPRLVMQFHGNRHFGNAKLERYATFGRAGIVDAVEIDNTRAQIRTAYQKDGYYAVDVRTDTSGASPNAITVLFLIDEGPRADIRAVELEGARALSPHDLTDGLITEPSGSIFESHWVDEWVASDVATLQARYVSAGFQEAKVDARYEVEPKGLRAIFAIHEGARSVVTDLVLTGLPPPLEREHLEKRLLLKPNAPYVAASLSVDESEILGTLAAAGYAHAKVAREVTRKGAADATGSAPASAAARSEERGARPSPEPGGGRAEELGASPSEELGVRPSTENGAGPSTEVTAGPSAGLAREEYALRYTIDPGARAILAGLFIRGNFRTSGAFMARELGLTPGEPLDLRALEEGKRRLRDLGVFGALDVRPLGENEMRSDTWLLLAVGERDLRTVDAVVSFATDELFSVGADYHDNNLFGRAIRLELSARLSNASELVWDELRIGNRDRLELSLRAPHPLQLPLYLQLAATYDLQDKQVYRERRVGANAAAVIPIINRATCMSCLGVQGLLGYELVSSDFRVREGATLPPGVTQQGTIGRLVPRLTIDDRDSLTDPRRGYEVTAQFEMARPLLAFGLADAASFLRVLSSAQLYVRAATPPTYRLEGGGVLGGPIIVALSANFGHVWPWAGATTIPASETLAYGGDTSVRGIPERASEIGAPGATYLATASMELRWYAWQELGAGALQLAAVSDLGTVAYTFSGLFDAATLTAGPAMRYVTPIGPLSLAWVWPINRADGVPGGGRLHFTFGYAF